MTRCRSGLPPTKPSLEANVAMLAGAGLQWLVAVLGDDVVQSGMAELALQRGAHVRVGSRTMRGERTPSNLEFVEEVAAVIASGGRTVARPQETRELLS